MAEQLKEESLDGNLEERKRRHSILRAMTARSIRWRITKEKPWCYIFIRGTIRRDVRRKPAAFATWGRP